jgi:hypothetical protein
VGPDWSSCSELDNTQIESLSSYGHYRLGRDLTATAFFPMFGKLDYTGFTSGTVSRWSPGVSVPQEGGCTNGL